MFPLRRSALLVAVCCASAALIAPSASAAPGGEQRGNGPDNRLKDLQILAVNDFHGNLEAPAGSSGRVVTGHTVDAAGKVVDTTVDAGGAAYLSTHLTNLRQGQRSTFTVSSGDAIGASPLLSAAFHDEPTIEALRIMDVDAATVGNHEFDEGYRELLRIVRGGCIDDGDGADNQNSCAQHTYRGTGFPVLAANVYYAGTTKTILPAYTVLEDKGIKLGVIGVVLKDTANIVTKGGIVGIDFGDEVEAVNRAAAALRARGVHTMVALVHQGAEAKKMPWTAPTGVTYPAGTAFDARCTSGTTDLLDGSAILPIARLIDADVDAILTAHSHVAYACEVPDPKGVNRPVTQSLSFGRLITQLQFKYDPKTKDVRRDLTSAGQVIVTRDVTPDPRITALIASYSELIKPIASRVLGQITSAVTKAPNAAGESLLGDLVADAQLADTSVTGGGTPVIAFMNPGGIRADLTMTSAGGPGVVTFADAFAVQPFNNYLVSMTMTGAQLSTLLTQQFTGANAAAPRILQVSRGFSYAWRQGLAGPEIVPGSMLLNGVPIDAAQSYRIVANSFLSDGGDGFGAFTGATNKIFGGLDIDGFARYLQASSPYTPVPGQRITRL